MKEAFFILVVIGVLIGLTAIRYRRQIVGMIHVWRSLKSMRAQVKEKQGEAQDTISSGPLVNCAKCGTWVPEQRAIKLRGGVVYCSTSCMETSVTAR
ncbi:MAG: hypothetical protein ABI646_04385 [Acidobacteriota bacterium]